MSNRKKGKSKFNKLKVNIKTLQVAEQEEILGKLQTL